MPKLGIKVPSKFAKHQEMVISNIQIHKIQNRPSTKTILEKCSFSFSFKTPTKILKQNIDFFSPFKLGYVNKSISSSTFPAILKLADIIPVYKKRFSIGEK